MFLFFSIATLFSLATLATATHSLRQSGCTFRDRKRTAVPTRTSYSLHSTKQYKRHATIEAQANTLEEAQYTQLKQSLASKSPRQPREHPTVTKLFWMGQGKLRRGTQQQHKKATPHSSPCQNEQTTSGIEFLHNIHDTRGTY